MKYKIFFCILCIIFIKIYTDNLAYVKNINGESIIKHYFAQENLLKGEIININDTIISSPGSFIEIEFLNDSSLIKLISLCEIVIENSDIHNINISLLSGNIYIKTLNRMIIDTRLASISSLNGEFYIIENKDGYKIFCLEGEIIVFNEYYQVQIQSGEIAEINNENSIQKIIETIDFNIPKNINKNANIDIEFEDENNNKRILSIEVQ